MACALFSAKESEIQVPGGRGDGDSEQATRSSQESQTIQYENEDSTEHRGQAVAGTLGRGETEEGKEVQVQVGSHAVMQLIASGQLLAGQAQTAFHMTCA